MRIQICWAVCALALGLFAQGSPAGRLNAAEDETTQRITALEQQLTDLQAQLGRTGGGERDVVCDTECARGGLYGGAELVLLKPHLGSLGGSLGSGPTTMLMPEFDYGASPRLWLGYETPGGVGLQATYWNFDHSTSMPDPFGGVATIGLGLQAQTLDLDASVRGCLEQTELQFLGGLRYGKLNLDLSLTDISAGNQDVGGELAAQFEGFGPTVGLNVRRPFGCRGFALTGGLRGAWLYGDTSLALSQTQPRTRPLVSVVAEDHMMQVWETRVGLDWTRTLSSGSQLFARVALEAQAWEWAPVAFLIHEDIGFVGPTFALGFTL
jgi:Legionella pneumophila major outer membrane protein precursor